MKKLLPTTWDPHYRRDMAIGTVAFAICAAGAGIQIWIGTPGMATILISSLYGGLSGIAVGLMILRREQHREAKDIWELLEFQRLLRTLMKEPK